MVQCAEHTPHPEAGWLESWCLDRAMEATFAEDEQATRWWERAWRTTGDVARGHISHADAAEKAGRIAIDADLAGRPVVAASLRSCAQTHRDYAAAAT